ncbi:probable G-protein coupled receptor 139 [Heterodontus francisci]|uniref:probable G-protein coupled receptor 139 n=1 Tax=Heterodontus francisci TaxID=7792 RepID=UPI00355C55E0
MKRSAQPNPPIFVFSQAGQLPWETPSEGGQQSTYEEEQSEAVVLHDSPVLCTSADTFIFVDYEKEQPCVIRIRVSNRALSKLSCLYWFNLVAIAILVRGKCGLSKCTIYYLVAMAVADLLVVITSVILNRIIAISFPGNYLLLTPVCRAKTVLVYVTREISVWFTVAFTVDRFIAICFQKIKTKYCIRETAAAIISMVVVLSCFENIPWYFVYEPLYINYELPWYCRIRSIFYTSPLWQAFSYFSSITVPYLPFFIILLLNILTVRYIFVASRVHRALRGNNSSANNPDPEKENRKKSILLLFSISANYRLLWLTHAIHYVYYRMTNNYSYTGYDDPVYIFQETGYMLQRLSCCTNTFIYAVTQAKFREELKKMLTYPVKKICSASLI